MNPFTPISMCRADFSAADTGQKKPGFSAARLQGLLAELLPGPDSCKTGTPHLAPLAVARARCFVERKFVQNVRDIERRCWEKQACSGGCPIPESWCTYRHIGQSSCVVLERGATPDGVRATQTHAEKCANRNADYL